MSNRVDISPYLATKFGAVLRNNNWRFSCPFCDDDKEKFGISISKGVAHCFKCDYSGSVLKFVSDVEGVSIGEVFKILTHYPKMVTPGVKKVKPKGSRFNPGLPAYVPLWDIGYKSPTTSLATSYLKRRNLGKEDIKFWRLGISRSEQYTGRIIIPFHERKEVVYFIARKFMGGGPKYLNPSNEMFGIGKSDLVYNIDSARKFKEIIICEGVFDVMAMGKNCVAIMGKDISQVQLRKILKTGCTKVGILLDSDAVLEAYKMAELFSAYIPASILKLEKGDPASSRISLSSLPRQRFSLADMLRAQIESKS